jgi:hypothetical protein
MAGGNGNGPPLRGGGGATPGDKIVIRLPRGGGSGRRRGGQCLAQDGEQISDPVAGAGADGHQGAVVGQFPKRLQGGEAAGELVTTELIALGDGE